MNNPISNLEIENAHIIYRNFSGQSDDRRFAGKRGFSVVIDNQEMAEKLMEDGWTLREMPPREEGDSVRWHMPVTVKFGAYPPAINLVSGGSMTRLSEDDVDILDGIDLASVDLIIRPYCWEMNGKSGVKAYLKAGYFVQNQDRFSTKYATFAHSDDENLPF